MDWIALKNTFPRDTQMPERFNALTAFERVLDGTQYDALTYAFSDEKNGAGEYVTLDKRRPSVRTNWCRVVVDDVASLLFSEGHWPSIKATAPASEVLFAQLTRDTHLNRVMLQAVTRGSIGSVAIRMRVLKGKPFFDVMPTPALTPMWHADDPDTLLTVTELRVVVGSDLAAAGYTIGSDQAAARFWFKRVWDDQAETWFQPVPIADFRQVWRIDPDRTVRHGLGFVPIVWCKNLAAPAGSPDGECTFRIAIDTTIEADYLLSQGGRALKYASDPTLVIKQGDAGDETPPRIGGAANALEVPPEGDAKLLEINGQSAKAVLEHVQELRALALETMHGNRAHADKMQTATSGRSIELMMVGLIWLADRLRVNYGEEGLSPLLRMVCAASSVMDDGVLIGGKLCKDVDPTGMTLAWRAWMPPIPQDVLQTAQALMTASSGKILSRQTAMERLSSMIEVDDTKAEWARLEKEAATDPAPDASVPRTAALTGKSATRQDTA